MIVTHLEARPCDRSWPRGPRAFDRARVSPRSWCRSWRRPISSPRRPSSSSSSTGSERWATVVGLGLERRHRSSGSRNIPSDVRNRGARSDRMVWETWSTRRPASSSRRRACWRDDALSSWGRRKTSSGCPPPTPAVTFSLSLEDLHEPQFYIWPVSLRKACLAPSTLIASSNRRV